MLSKSARAGVCFGALFFVLACAHGDSEPLSATARRVVLLANFTADVDKTVEAAVDDSAARGFVTLVSSGGETVHLKAYGRRAVGALDEAMTVDTVFDAASLTKVVVTTTAVAILLDEKKLRLNDPIAAFWPEFAANGKGGVTVEHLLRHRGGFVPDNPIGDYEHGAAAALGRIAALPLTQPPGEKYVYTDVGFIVLGRLVEIVSGQSLDRFAAERIFAPLGMKDSRFVRTGDAVDPEWLARVAPTEPAEKGGAALRGVVHDPRARKMGGVAGHAGLFTTAADLAAFARMMLDEGRTTGGASILSAATIRELRDPGTTSGAERRGLGWDMRAPEHWSTRPGGRLFPLDGYGHTGFTGTSIWLDPSARTAVILLSSRLHDNPKGEVSKVRMALADAVANGMVRPDTATSLLPGPRVLTGADRVASGHWPRLFNGARVGLITNHTGRDATGRSTIDILAKHPRVKLVRLFSPEHGIRGEKDEKVGDDVDPSTGLKICSLYGDTRRPTPEMLEGLDVLVFDIQDIGTRFYTYISTMVYAMEEAAKAKLGFVVLDRPNPIGGVEVEGPLADPDDLDFVGVLPIPIRHGLTIGEVATAARLFLKLDDLRVKVIETIGWRKEMLFDETGLPWINPSPNMRSLDEAILYPGIGLLETTNLSVGRGTATPFEHIGAPWLDGERLALELNALGLAGVRISPTTFTPDASVHKNELCRGVRFEILDRRSFRPVALGLALAKTLRRLHPLDWKTDKLNRLLKNRSLLTTLLQ